jgi:predicted RNase H-like nuclease (RuvC/YqgF family)
MSTPPGPPFASALRSRHFTATRNDFSTSAPLPSHNDRPSSPDRNIELDRLQAVVQDLEAQLARLTAENTRANELRTDIDFSREMITQYQSQIEEQKGKLRVAKFRNQRLEDRVAQLKLQLENKRQEANDKEKILEQLQMDITLLSGDFQRLLERTAHHRASVNQKAVDDVSPQRFNAYQVFDEPVPEPWRPVEQPPAEIVRTVQDSWSPPPRRSPAALVDNISFGEVKPGVSVTAGKSVPELKAELKELLDEKAKMEWHAQRAPAPGVSAPRARRERAELEAQLEELEKRIGQIRLALKQFGAGFV